MPLFMMLESANFNSLNDLLHVFKAEEALRQSNNDFNEAINKLLAGED